MQKKLLLLTVLLGLSFAGSGQGRMNFALARQLQKGGTQQMDVLVQGDIGMIRRALSSNGGTLKYFSGDIASVRLPLASVGKLLQEPGIKRIEAYPQHIAALNDTMLINNNVIPVHNGTPPLPQAYDGNGVVVGFIDTGIDFSHPDFKDSVGNSRIKFLWDQAQPLAANTPLPYNYGQEWSNSDIDAGLASAHSDVSQGGHGTHVAGIGVGNGLASGTYKGVAPKADIIMVAIDFSSSSTSLIPDAVDYIFSKAQAMGKPCVINASLGDYYGSHDGLDLASQLIRNEIIAQPGRALVAAVGNGGNFPYHLGYTVTSDTSFTFYENTSGSIYIAMYADTNDLKNVDFSIGADQMSPYHSFRGHIPFSDISSHLGLLLADTLYNGGNRLGIIQSYGDLVGGVYSMEFLINADSANYNWRLMTTGTGKFDAWTFDFFPGSLPSASTMPDSIYYKPTDTMETMVSGFQCLNEVIAVGNYTNRKTYIDYTGSVYVNTATDPGFIHPTSSHGPTRDGRLKPDICSPGDMTVAAVVLSLVPGIAATSPDILSVDGFHNRNGGSSHASPSVAGIAALYFQKNPGLTYADFKHDMIACAKWDSFTGSALPDNTWGNGKIDAYGTLTCDPLSSAENNGNPSFNVFPNPSDGNQVMITFTGLHPENNPELRISNALGQEILRMKISADKLSLDETMSPGIYFIGLYSKGNKTGTKKLIIL